MRAATTRDHIPPKSIFVEPYPRNLVTVPACGECNNKSNLLDAEFRVSISMNVGIDTPKTFALWKQHALRTLGKNQKAARRILESGRQVQLKSPAGLILRKAFAVPYSVRAHNAVIDRIVRGLFYHHFKVILGRRAKIRSSPLRDIPAEFGKTVKDWPFGRVGVDEFFYRFARAAEAPLNSVWILLFYDRYCVMAETRSKIRSNNAFETGATAGAATLSQRAA